MLQKRRLYDLKTKDIISEEDQPFVANNMAFLINVKISFEDVAQITGSRTGICEKKSNRLLSKLLPCFYSRWQKRYLVLLGNYLYRFETDRSEKTKGLPISIDDTNIDFYKDEYTGSVDKSILCIRTIRKEYIFRFDSTEDASSWQQALINRQHYIIKEKLGHAKVDPEVAKFNKISESLFRQAVEHDKRNNEISNPLLNGQIM